MSGKSKAPRASATSGAGKSAGVPGESTPLDDLVLRRGKGKPDPTRLSGAWVISDQARAALQRCELFQDLDRWQLMAVAALVEERAFQPEDTLVREGDPTRNLYVVVEGRGVAELQTEYGWLTLGLVGPGDVVGWSALVDVKVYPASVKALTSMQAARIDAEGLKLLMNVEPELGYPVHKRLSAIFCRQYEAALRALKSGG